jgi:hypothetical protein
VTRPADRQAEDQRHDDRRREPGEKGDAAAEYRGSVALVDAQCDAHDCVIFWPDDHGTDDEYLRIGQDADSANQPGNSQQDEEAGSVDGI